MSKEELKGRVLNIVSEITKGKPIQEKPQGDVAANSPLRNSNHFCQEEGALDISMGFRQCVKDAISSSGKDKYQIAEEIGRLTGNGKFVHTMVDGWISKDQTVGMSAEDLTAFCYVTGTLEPLRFLLKPLNCDIICTR